MKPKYTESKPSYRNSNQERLTLNTLHRHLSNIMGWNAQVLVTGTPDGGLVVTPVAETQQLVAAPAATVYPFTKEDETFLRSLKIRLEPI